MESNEFVLSKMDFITSNAVYLQASLADENNSRIESESWNLRKVAYTVVSDSKTYNIPAYEWTVAECTAFKGYLLKLMLQLDKQ